MSEPSPQIDPERARELLRHERERIQGALADVERAVAGELEGIDVETAPEDDAELIEDEGVDTALAAQLRWELEAVERAERRVEERTYGLSVESGEPIPDARLEAVPTAERTIEEQQVHNRR